MKIDYKNQMECGLGRRDRYTLFAKTDGPGHTAMKEIPDPTPLTWGDRVIDWTATPSHQYSTLSPSEQ